MVLLGISKPSFYRLIDRAELPVVEVGGRRLVEPAELRRFVEEHRRLGRSIKSEDRRCQPVLANPADQGGGDGGTG
jgi:excisionase family DNA binding protein